MDLALTRAHNQEPVMTPNTDAIRRRLLSRRHEVVAHLRSQDALAAEELDGPEIEAVENATEQWDAKVLASLGDADLRTLTWITAALGRLDAGTYGTCAICRGPISDGRLAAIPEAVTCFECATSRDGLESSG
jgi:RNA polymerase-binding transcription factor DksA